MSSIIPAGVSVGFEVTYDRSDLDVAMIVRDRAGVQIGTAIAMPIAEGYTYRGFFTGVAGQDYVINKSVYTDNTYTTRADYPQGSEDVACVDIGGSGGGGSSNSIRVVVRQNKITVRVGC